MAELCSASSETSGSESESDFDPAVDLPLELQVFAWALGDPPTDPVVQWLAGIGIDVPEEIVAEEWDRAHEAAAAHAADESEDSESGSSSDSSAAGAGPSLWDLCDGAQQAAEAPLDDETLAAFLGSFGETTEFSESACSCETCSAIHAATSTWGSWVPRNLLESVVRRAVNAVERKVNNDVYRECHVTGAAVPKTPHNQVARGRLPD